MSRNIVVCCDGTGNEYGKKNTNVVEVYKTLDLEYPEKQIAYYDPGVGTMGDPALSTGVGKTVNKGLGLAFGRGMTRNMEDAYRYIMNSYRKGDRLFLFGFSRGAYTARALAGMIHKMGLLKKGSENLIPYALKLYKKHPETPDEWRIVNGFKKTFARPCKVHFMGVWDTVKSVGWFRRRVTLDFTMNNPSIRYGRHAVAIDEKRSQYRTNLWGSKNRSDFREVWFAGVHSDVGGSYEENGLSNVSLKWMLDAARSYGMIIDEDKLAAIIPDPMGKMHNPLTPFWWLLGWAKRKVRTMCREEGAMVWVHSSVKVRQEGDPKYKPAIPDDAVFVEG